VGVVRVLFTGNGSSGVHGCPHGGSDVSRSRIRQGCRPSARGPHRYGDIARAWTRGRCRPPRV
jgi:hypothetical protein